MNLETLTIREARRALDAKEYTAHALAAAFLERIEKMNPELHAYLEVFDDVLKQADAADARIQQGESAPLLGIPLAIKDNILIKGKRVSAASKILEGYVAPYNAHVIERLIAQGAVFLGRTNMDEFAMGGSTENSAFGRTMNPHDASRVPGGSSGGSAAALAAHLCLGALGTDTGGSIRQPAALCGIVGMKGTYGSVSRFGAIAMGSSLDQIGPFGKNTADTYILFDAIQGHDPRDATSLPDRALSTKQPKVIGVPRAFLAEGTDPDVLARFEESLTALKAAGYDIRDIELPAIPHSLAVYYIVMPAEASTNLARFDGVRFGLAVPGEHVLDTYKKTRGQGFGKEVRRRILIGTYVLSSGYVDAYYRKAEAVRALIKDDFARAFAEVDVIATPTSPTPAFKAGEKEDPLAMYAADIFTVPVNLAGIPGLSVPMGTVARDDAALPVGIQFMAAHGNEQALFTVGAAIEAAML
ncbi:MAG: Asp-tRNA(Asn)/Glu-tRNA(Gln) amidotransferase subunit GatA [Candidatus Pacebacteria bacterium]|nr:Asp-tRNA(Asn)/Glu-tRNA(Gln) amidotransferase subunit GatA [Candidatus Paceibacterota bacterium]